MQIRIDESAYSSKFHDIIHSWDRYIIAYGGRGSSKTDSFYFKYLISLFEPYYFRLAYINKEKSNIRDQQYAGFIRVAKRCGFYDKLKFYDGDYRVVNPANGNTLIPKGMDDPEKTKGLDDITAIWWDEINKGTYEDFSALNELLRSPMAKYLQFAMSFNPVSEQHWLREKFFSKADAHKAHPEYEGQMLLNRSTYKDNEFIDQEAYLDTMLKTASGNINAIRVNIEGDWGLEENENPWLYNFDPQRHLKRVDFLPSFPVYLSFDFNNDPLACVAYQFLPNLGHKSAFLHYIKEFSGTVKLEELCQRIKMTYPASILFVTGDRSGLNEDTGRLQTLYQIIQSILKLSDKQMHMNSYNLEHGDSRILCNIMLAQYPNMFIDPVNCPNLSRQCQAAEVDTESLKASHLLKDRGMNKNDEFDAFRYSLQTDFNKFVRETFLKIQKK